MSSCLSAGGRTYGFDLEIVKSSSSLTRTSQTSSPSSTLSESINSPLAISTRKPRTTRKRPNQTYNEAAVLLSTAYPNIFSTKQIANPRKFSKQYESFSDESSELFLPFRVIDDSGFLLCQSIQGKPSFRNEFKVSNFCEKHCQSQLNSMDLYEEDFDTESILDEEVEEGIDSIMGNPSVDTNVVNECLNPTAYYRNPMGMGFGAKFEFGMRRGLRALKHVDDGNWWRFPTIDVHQISPKFNKVPVSVPKSHELAKENSVPSSDWSGLGLKLNYEMILDAWSGQESPISKEIPDSEASGDDIYATLAQIDLFAENGGAREASVSRYKEKRRTRLFSKMIRYQVRKVNADQRPRMKGRFVRRPKCSNTDQR